MSTSRTQHPSSDEAATRSGESVTRILEVAEALFAEHGFEAVSMNAVAERAGVSKANVFHHFTSKRELYLAVLRNACEKCTEHLDNLETRDSSFEQRFATYAVDMLHDMLERESLHRLMLRELLSDDDGRVAKELAERVFGAKFARLVAVLRTGQERGELRADFEPAMAATMLVGMNVFYLQSRHVFKHLPDTRFAAEPQRYSRLLVDIILRGIMINPSTSAISE